MRPRSPSTEAGPPLVVLITGAAQGIGRATATALAERGFRRALLDRAAEPLDDLAKSLRDTRATVATQTADVRDDSSLKQAVAQLEEQLGVPDVVVACAGVGTLSTVLNLDLEGFRTMLDVNILGVARTIEAVLPGMFARGSGHLVGISSMAGYRGLPWMPGYSASKAGLTTYLEGLRPALKRRGVTVTTVYPGFVRTAMTVSTPFRRPVAMLEPDVAAKFIVRAVLRRPRDYAFPPSTALGMAVFRRLPCWIFDRLLDRAGPEVLTTEF